MTAGERWARDELERLRGRHFSPAAVAAFLRASGQRAAEIRAARPDVARRARQWELVGLAAWALAAAGGGRPFRRRLAPGVGWWAATCVILEWHLGMVESEDGRPRNLGPADALTLTRAWLVPVIADGGSPSALVIAATTDAMDGPVARAGTPTRAGRDLEGLVDAAVLVAALLATRRERSLHPALAALELARLAAGVAFSVAMYFTRAAPPSPTVLRAGRWTTPARVGGLLLAGAGHRRAANALLGAGSLASIGLLAAGAGSRPS